MHGGQDGFVPPGPYVYLRGKMEEETKLAMIAETEQNANIIFEEFKGTVMEMNPSLAAVTMAAGMFFRYMIKLMASSEWSEGQRDYHGDMVDKIVDQRLNEAFGQALSECNGLVNPELMPDTQLIHYEGLMVQ